MSWDCVAQETESKQYFLGPMTRIWPTVFWNWSLSMYNPEAEGSPWVDFLKTI
jgi:hypothetical protein